jgi:hypothetical protein
MSNRFWTASAPPLSAKAKVPTASISDRYGTLPSVVLSVGRQAREIGFAVQRVALEAEGELVPHRRMGELVGERQPDRAGADDENLGMIGHAAPPPSIARRA